MREAPDHPPLPEQFRSFGRAAGRDGNDVYRAICDGIAGDEGIVALMEAAPLEQRRPNLLLAAVHYLLLGGADHPLARHYPTVQAWRSGGGDPGPADRAGGDPFPEFADFCAGHGEALTTLLTHRATQTNEIGRCVALLAALAHLGARRPGRPWAVLDLGSSAGLNLLFDRYHYRLTGPTGPAGPTGEVVEAGDRGSVVTLTCELRGDTVPPLSLPTLSWRAGLDLRPLDPADPDGARWLLACLWPQQTARFARLRAALELAAAAPDRPVVERGDLLQDLPELARRTPPGSGLCLFHSWVAAYLTADEQRRLGEVVAGVAAELGPDRPVTWLFAEQPYEVPALPLPPAPDGRRDHTATALVAVEPGRGEARRLADLHPHGAWLRWWGG